MDPPPGMDYNAFRRWRTSQGIRGTRRDITSAWRAYSATTPSSTSKKTSTDRKRSTTRKASPRKVPSPVISPVGKSPPRVTSIEKVVSPRVGSPKNTRPFPLAHFKEYRVLTSIGDTDVDSLVPENIRERLIKLTPYVIGRLLGSPTLTSTGRTPYTRMWVFTREGHLLSLSDYKQTTASIAAMRGVLPTPEEFWESNNEGTFLIGSSKGTPEEYVEDLRRVLVGGAGR